MTTIQTVYPCARNLSLHTDGTMERSSSDNLPKLFSWQFHVNFSARKMVGFCRKLPWCFRFLILKIFGFSLDQNVIRKLTNQHTDNIYSAFSELLDRCNYNRPNCNFRIRFRPLRSVWSSSTLDHLVILMDSLSRIIFPWY